MLIGKTPQYFQLCVKEMQIGGWAFDQQFLELSNQEDVTLISKIAQWILNKPWHSIGSVILGRVLHSNYLKCLFWMFDLPLSVGETDVWGSQKELMIRGGFEVALPWGSFLLQCQLCLLIEEERAQEEWEMWQRVVQSPYTNIQPSTTTCIDNYTPEKKHKQFSILNMSNIASNTRGCKMERINNFPKLYLQSHYYRQVLRIVKNRIYLANIPSVSNNQQL